MYKRRIAALLFALAMALPFAACGKNGHKIEYIPHVEPTCMQAGLIGHYRCKDCGKCFSDENGKAEIDEIVLSALDHDFSEPVTNLTNCLDGGVSIRVCNRCKIEKREEIAPGQHDWDIQNVCKLCGVKCSATEGLSYTLIIENGAEIGYSVGGENVEGNSVVIPRYHGTLPVLEIESNAFQYKERLSGFVNYAQLRAIGDSAFDGCKKLGTVHLPESLQKIGALAFRNCALTEITLPDSVKEVGEYAFYGCSKLKSVTVGASVSRLGARDFLYCKLAQIAVSAENESYLGEGNCLIERATCALILGTSESVIPDYVTSIGASAFQERDVREINIPASVTVIGEFAFRDCTKLQKIVYAGTEGEWKAVQKGKEWDTNTHKNLIVEFAK